MKIGVFDSGIGGLSVAQAIEEALPDLTVIYAEDENHVTYGNKTPEELKKVSLPIIKQLQSDGCELIVIACNTITTNLLDDIKQELDIPVIGVEPMVRQALEKSKSGIITVCATPATLKSQRYSYLKKTYAQGKYLIEPDCSNWAYMIETNKIDKNIIKTIVDDSILQGSDMIVLGCTHYHWIEQEIKEIAGGRAEILHSEQLVIDQIRKILELS